MELDKGNNNLRNLYQIDSILNTEQQVNSGIEGYVEVAKTYEGGETDNIIVSIDNSKNIITATVKPIQFVSRETFPEIGSDRLLYTDNSENAIYRWDTGRNDYVLVGKDYTVDVISFRQDIDQNQMDISANRQAIADNKNEIDRLEREKITQTQMEEYTYDKQTIDDAIDDLDSDFTVLNQRVTDLEDEVETNIADIASNRSLIETNSQKLQEHDTLIQTNANEIANNKTAIQENASNIASNTADIASNRTAIATLRDESGNSIEISVDPLTYILTVNLKNKAGTIISTGTVDLPLETMVVSASYKDGTLTLTLQNGQMVDIDISSLVSGLVNQQTFNDEVTRLDGEITTLQGEVTAHDLTITSIEEANKDRDTKINALETKINEHEQELADYEVRIGENENAISDVQEQADATDEDLTNLTARVATNETAITDIKAEQKTQNDDINSLKISVGSIENSVSTLTTDLSTANDDISKLQDKTDTTNTNVEELTKRVETNETSIQTLTTKTDTINSALSTLSDKVDGIETNVTTNIQDITNLKSTTEQHTTDIQGVKDNLESKQDKLIAGENITIAEDGKTISANVPDSSKIDSISVNGQAQTIDENKNVDISVPTTLAELSDDETHRLVSDDEKTEWSGKQDKLKAGDNITIGADGTISSTATGGITEETDPTVPQFVKNITEEDISSWNAKSDFDGTYNSLSGKPTLGTLAGKNIVTETDLDSDVQLSLGKADTAVQPSALENYLLKTQRGANNGVASLDGSGKVPISQLPSFVDDVQEFDTSDDFPNTGEDGKIYVAKNTNLTYRWSGTGYVEISSSLALGETENTAYAGNKGKANADAIAKLQTDMTSKANQVDLTALTTRVTAVETKNEDQDTSISALETMAGATQGQVNSLQEMINNSPQIISDVKLSTEDGRTQYDTYIEFIIKSITDGDLEIDKKSIPINGLWVVGSEELGYHLELNEDAVKNMTIKGCNPSAAFAKNQINIWFKTGIDFYGDGYMLQAGIIGAMSGNSEATVNFACPFSSTSDMYCGCNSEVGGTAYRSNYSVTKFSTTSLTCRQNENACTNMRWFAIGKVNNMQAEQALSEYYG